MRPSPGREISASGGIVAGVEKGADGKGGQHVAAQGDGRSTRTPRLPAGRRESPISGRWVFVAAGGRPLGRRRGSGGRPPRKPLHVGSSRGPNPAIPRGWEEAGSRRSGEPCGSAGCPAKGTSLSPLTLRFPGYCLLPNSATSPSFQLHLFRAGAEKCSRKRPAPAGWLPRPFLLPLLSSSLRLFAL